MKQLRPDLYAIRGWIGWVHLLVGDAGVGLVDSGFIGDEQRLKRAILSLGFEPRDLKAVLLTHGHLDHAANAAALQDWSGAKVYAPVGDENHVAGNHHYRGVARLCGWMEAAGRAALQYRPPRVDVWMRDGDELPFWGGLRVVGLPGHTAGHVGFLAPGKRAFFPGDAFAVSWRIALPPGIFNTDSRQVRASFLKAARVDADLFVPAHYLWLPADLRERLASAADAR